MKIEKRIGEAILLLTFLVGLALIAKTITGNSQSMLPRDEPQIRSQK
jgi:hypothetical protein